MIYVYIIGAVLFWLIGMGFVYRGYCSTQDLGDVFFLGMFVTLGAVVWPWIALFAAPMGILYVFILKLLFPFYGWLFRPFDPRCPHS